MSIRILKGKKDQPQPEAPASDAAKPAKPSAAIDEVTAAEPATTEGATSHATLPAHPEVAEQPSAPGEAPQPEVPASFLTQHPDTSWADAKRDTTKKDSLGNEKSDDRTFGAASAPDSLTADERQANADVKDAQLRQGMASTVKKDSTGKPKGHFEVVPQGNDKHGARIPDKVNYSKPVEAPPVMVGPRGVGAAKDSFHGPRPGGK